MNSIDGQSSKDANPETHPGSVAPSGSKMVVGVGIGIGAAIGLGIAAVCRFPGQAARFIGTARTGSSGLDFIAFELFAQSRGVY